MQDRFRRAFAHVRDRWRGESSRPAFPQQDEPLPHGCRDFAMHDKIEKQQLEGLLQGRLLVYGVQSPFSGPSFNWALDATGERSWRFGLHNLKYVGLLFHADGGPGTPQKRRQRAEEILRSWHHVHQAGAEPSDCSWDEHATGIRAQVIACAANHLGLPEWLADLAHMHGERLADLNFHAGQWNHGFDQDLGLFAIGCALGRRDWVETAETRLSALLGESIDEEGVANEQAVGYQLYNYVLYSELARQLAVADRPPLRNLERRALMPEFLAHATLPNGRYVPLGDSLYERSAVIEGTAAEYAATQGRSGPKPSERTRAYDAGFAFGRATWRTDSDYEQQPFYAIRYGLGRAIHGHRDHTALYYYTRGLPRLVEAGFGGYGNPQMRAAEQLEHAHNAVVSDDAGRFLWAERTILTARDITSTHDYYRLLDRPYAGVERRREVLMLLDRDLIIVRDQIDSAHPHTFEQLWHLPEHARPAVEKDCAMLHYDDDVVACMTQLGDGDHLLVLQGQEDPPRGWIAYERDRRMPAPLVSCSAHGTAIEFLTVFDFRDGALAERRAEDIWLHGEDRPVARLDADRLSAF